MGRTAKRRKVSEDDGAANGGPRPVEDLEREREILMERNRMMMSLLGVNQAAARVERVVASAAVTVGTASSAAPRPRPPAKKPQKRERTEEPSQPVRRSSRVAGGPAPAEELGAEGELLHVDEEGAGSKGPGLMTQEAYFRREGRELPEGHFTTAGTFSGWVEEGIRKQYNIATCAAAAWDENGGGKFQRKINSADIPKDLKAQGWSSARAFAATQLQKNPNAYFYRHTAPHLEQAQGDWTEEEHDKFLDTARKYGVGDKWGLFASHVGTRVGYQCSAYYTQVILPSGMILDARYRLGGSNGKAAFVG